MRKEDDGGGNRDVPAALITALLAAGLAGPREIDLESRTDEDKPNKAVEHSSFGSPSVMPPSNEAVSWARRQLSSLASDE
jgi:hypothetical protein